MDPLRSDDIAWDSDFWQAVEREPLLMGQGPVESVTAHEAVVDGLSRENAALREALQSVRDDTRVYRDLVSELLATVARLNKEIADAREQLWQWRKEHSGRP